MKINTEQNLHVEIKDSLNISSANIKIEAAHSGVINGNHLFYLPSALTTAAETANVFPKPLQKKHYDKTLGYIYNTTYEEKDTDSEYYKAICNYKDAKDLVSSVKKYITTDEYKRNKTGFGVLVSKARLFNPSKIRDLQNGDSGTVSVAGSGAAVCSICAGFISDCPHKLGRTYQGQTCFGIVGNFALDHISFETIPANWETNSIIIADSQLSGKLEFIKEGQPMTLEELKGKLSEENLPALFESLGLTQYLTKYTKESKSANKSQYLLAKESLLPTNTHLTTYVAKLLVDGLTDSADKETLNTLLSPKYESFFSGKTSEEILASLNTKVTKKVQAKEEPEPEAVKAEEEKKENKQEELTEPQTEIKDANDIYSLIADRIKDEVSQAVESISKALQDSKDGEANSLLLDQINCYQADLDNANDTIDQLTESLRQSLLGQILVMKQVDPDSDYFAQLQDRNVQELQITLQDHQALYNQACAALDITDSKKEPEVIKEPEPQVTQPTEEPKLEKTQVGEAVDNMTTDKDVVTKEKEIEITDADTYITSVLESTTSKLSGSEYASLYKQTIMSHGSSVAKKLSAALKTARKI